MAATERKTQSNPTTVRKKKTVNPPGSSDNQLMDLLVGGLRELYWAENHLVLNLPKIQEAAVSSALRKAVADHWKVTKGHVVRLEKAFEVLGVAPLARKCDGVEGLVMEGEGVIDSTQPGSQARLTGLIMACQKVENYEITAYRGLNLLASQLGLADVADLLETTMNEEQQANDILSELAQKD